MATPLGFYNTSGTRTHVRFQFSTNAAAGGNVAPLSAFEAADLRIYKAADGAAFSNVQRSSSNGITVTSPFDTLTGFHDVDIDLTDNTDAGFYASGCFYSVVLSPDTETVDSQTITGKVLAYFEIGVAPANVTQFGGTAGTFSGGRPEVNTTHAAGTAWNSGAIAAATIADGAIDAATFAAGAIDAAAIAANAIGASELAADAVTEIVNAVWDEVLTAATHNVATSAGRRLRQIASLATVDSSVNDAAATTTSFVTALTTAVNNFYNDQLLIFTSGNLSGQASPILSYNGTTKAVTLAEALTSAPANSDTFTIQATHIHPVSQIASGIWQDTTAGDFTVASSIGKSIMNGVALGTGLTINGYTGNTPQTGDVYAAITGVTVEPTSPPASTASILSKILWLFSLGKNKRTQTSTTELVRNDADNATIGTATKSDDGTTFIRGKYV